MLLAQTNVDNVNGWIQVLLQGGVAVYMIWWFTTKHIQAQNNVANALKENGDQHSRAMSKVAAALRESADSNIAAVLAIKELDAQHAILRLATEQKKKMATEETPIT